MIPGLWDKALKVTQLQLIFIVKWHSFVFHFSVLPTLGIRTSSDNFPHNVFNSDSSRVSPLPTTLILGPSIPPTEDIAPFKIIDLVCALHPGRWHQILSSYLLHAGASALFLQSLCYFIRPEVSGWYRHNRTSEPCIQAHIDTSFIMK